MANMLGLTIIPSWRLDQYPFEIFLRRLFDLYKIDLVIDVGANLGQYRDFIRKAVGFEGWIVSFEPDPECLKARKCWRSVNTQTPNGILNPMR